MVKSFISEDDIEQELLQKLQHLYGFDVLECDISLKEELNDGSGRLDKQQVILPQRLRQSCLDLNPDIPQESIEQALEQLLDLRQAVSLEAANKDVDELIRDGVPVEYEDPQGELQHRRVRVINFEQQDKNQYLAVSQLWIKSTGVSPFKNWRRPDVLLYVNGLPLVFIELKNSTVKLQSAFDENLSDYKNDIPQLFHCNAFCILSNAIETKVGSFSAKWEYFFNWLRADDEKQKVDRKRIQQQGTSLEHAIAGLCRADRLLDYVENFVMFKGDSAKIIAQNHQFLGVNKAFNNLLNREQLAGKLGVFWHTQGSGKSFSMIFLARKVFRKLTGNFSFVVVTDRVDLDDQIYNNFVSTDTIAANYAARPKNSEQMRAFLRSNKKIVFTRIQKFNWPKGKPYKPLLTDPNREVIVLVDEAHRSQYEDFAKNMRDGLKGAHFMAFTGTPLLGNKSKTNAWFGEYVSEYNFQQAMDDNATVPLYYNKRVPKVDLSNSELGDDFYELLENEDLEDAQKQKLEDKYAREIEVIGRDERLDIVAKDIAYHFPRRGYLGKAMVISLDKYTAVKMYNKVQAQWKQEKKRLRSRVSKSTNDIEKQRFKQIIRYMDTVEMAVVISIDGKDIERFKKRKLDLTPHIERMKQLDAEKCTIEDNFKDETHPLQMVFVCAMWLTGFDAPTVSTLYLDKPMKNHTLMQTIARANRVTGYRVLSHSGKLVEKKNGEVVDYFNVFRNMEKALQAYALGSKRKGGDEKEPEQDGTTQRPIVEKKELFKLLDEAIEQTLEFCEQREIDLQIIAEQQEIFKSVALFDTYANILFSNDDWRRSFNVYDNIVSSIYEASKPEVFDEKPRLLVPIINYLRGILDAYVGQTDIDKVGQKVCELLDESVVVNNSDKFGVREHSVTYEMVPSGRKLDLSQVDFSRWQEEFTQAPNKHIEIAQLRTFIEDKLRQMLAQNRTRIGFGERFEEIVLRYNADSSQADNTFDELMKFYRDMTNEEHRAAREDLNDDELELFDTLKKDKLTKAEERKVKLAAKHLIERLTQSKPKVLVQDWWRDSQTRKQVESTVEEVLDDDLPESYSRIEFKEKSQTVFDMIMEFAKKKIKWVA